MAQPESWAPSLIYKTYAAQNPAAPFPPASLDTDFANLEITLTDILFNLQLIQRDDGQLQNELVTVNSLGQDVKNLIGNWNPRGVWVTATNYAVKDMVTPTGGTTTYVCAIAHTSSAAFATDLALGRWQPVNGASATAGVSTFNGRGGIVTLLSADVTSALGFTPLNPANNLSEVTAATARTNLGLGTMALQDASLYALIASPTFTGVPAAPKATFGTNTTQLATTSFVQDAVTASVTGVASFNARTGAVSLTSADVTTALTYTPLNPANNLSDVALAATARSNLGLGSLATVSNLSGPITSAGSATAVASQTGTGSTFVMQSSPSFLGDVSFPGGGIWSSSGIVGIGGSPGWGLAGLQITAPLAGVDGLTTAAPVADLSIFGLAGYANDTVSSAAGATINFRAAETWSPTAHGTYIQFRTVAAGTTSFAERMRLGAHGNLGVGVIPTNGHGLVQVAGYIKSFGVASLRGYGCVGDGTTDDTVAFQAACDSGYQVYIDPGTYRITSAITSTGKDLTIFGAGPNASIIKVDGAINGITFTGTRAAYTVNQLVVRGVSFLANNAACAAAIQGTWTNSGSITVQPRTCHISEISVKPTAVALSFLQGIFLTGGDNAVIRDSYITNDTFGGGFRAGGAAVELRSTSTMGAFETDITNLTVLQSETGIKYNADASAANNNCQGLYVSHCHLINCATCMLIGNAAAVPAGPIIEPSVRLVNNFIQAQAIGVDIQAQAQFSAIGNLFYAVAGANEIGLKYTSVNAGGAQVDGVIQGNTFVNVNSTGTTLGVSIVGNAGMNESVLIDGNTFENWTNSAKFDTNTSGATYAASNKVISGGGPSNLGTGNDIWFRDNAVASMTGATYSVLDGDRYLVANRAGTVTITFPAASAYPGRSIIVKTIQNQTVVSAGSNVVPLAGGAAGTAILAATAGKFANLASDGSNWITMEAN